MASSTDTLSLSLAGKVAVITGSGKENGIGAGIALALVRAGASVVINYVSESTAKRAVDAVQMLEDIGGKGCCAVVQADVSTTEGAKELINRALRELDVGRIDILVNNAAWATPTPALQQSPNEVERSFATNVYGPLYLIQNVIPHMPRGGRIINIGTVASKLAIQGMPMYVASKAAMDALTLALSRELGRDGKGITINTIAPGPVQTDSMPPVAPEMKVLMDWLVSLTRAEERTGTVHDIADAVLLLASEKSRWITGQYISVSGGITGN